METGTIDEEITLKLREVLDPEVGLNIVDLGLVYGAGIDRDRKTIHVTMTFTTPHCPAGPYISDEVREVLNAAWSDYAIDLDVVFSPLWSVDRITESGRQYLGMS